MDDLDPLVVICPIQYQCLELSLETGLEALAGLKGLRDLKIANMDHTMGAQEIEWMVRKGVWPKLELIEGVSNGTIVTPLTNLNHTSTTATVAKAEDNPAEWLRRHRHTVAVNGDRAWSR